MRITEKEYREKKWQEFRYWRHYDGMHGGYYFDPQKGFVVKYNSRNTHMTFKKLNSHYRRQKIKALLKKGEYDQVTARYEIDIWGWD